MEEGSSVEENGVVEEDSRSTVGRSTGIARRIAKWSEKTKNRSFLPKVVANRLQGLARLIVVWWLKRWKRVCVVAHC